MQVNLCPAESKHINIATAINAVFPLSMKRIRNKHKSNKDNNEKIPLQYSFTDNVSNDFDVLLNQIRDENTALHKLLKSIEQPDTTSYEGKS